MNVEPGAHVYMLRCADGSYYVGSARLGLERRLSEHFMDAIPQGEVVAVKSSS